MFEHIQDDLKYRVKDLKSQLIKRFEIDFSSESESDSESESESDDKKIKNKYFYPIPGLPIKFKLTDDGKSEIDSKCLTNVEDPDESESESERESEIDNEKIKNSNQHKC